MYCGSPLGTTDSAAWTVSDIFLYGVANLIIFLYALEADQCARTDLVTASK